MGQSEYRVGLSPAKPEDMEAVAFAFRAGERKAAESIINLISVSTSTELLIDQIKKEYKIEANAN